MRLCLAFLALLALPVSAGSASEEDAGRAAYDAGKQAFDRGAFDVAYSKFSTAYSLTRRPALLFNMSSALQKLDRATEAADALRAYLRQVPDDPDRSAIEERIRTLDERAGALELKARLRETEQRLRDHPAAPAAPAALALTASPPPPIKHQSLTRKWWFWSALVVGAGAVATAIAVPLATHYFAQDPFVGTLGARKEN